MNWRTGLLYAVVLFASLFLASGNAAPAPYPSNGGIAAKIQPFVDREVIPGAVMLVANKEKILDLETVGYSDFDKKTPMDPNALFMVCSMTKSVTGVGLMMLVDEGKVKLDDPVEKYLPSFKGQMVDDGKNPPHPPKHPITVREVMDHTAGLHGGPIMSKKPPLNVVENASILGREPLKFEPGTKYEYGHGPLVAGAIIEAVSGMPYGDFIKQRIFDPLGMKESTFWPSGELGERLAVTGQHDPKTQKLKDLCHSPEVLNVQAICGPVPPRVISQTGRAIVYDYKNHFTAPDAGLYSTALDWARFSQMLLCGGTFEGKQYLSPEAFKELSTNQIGNLFPKKAEGYGICVFVQRIPSDDGPTPGSFGHRGARKTVFWVDPADDLVMVFMTQTFETKSPDQAALNTAFFKTAIERYGKKASSHASTAAN